MKNQKKTIKELIDGAMREIDNIRMPRDLINIEKSELFWKWWVKEVKPFFRQSLLKIAQATAEAGRVEKIEETLDNPSVFHSRNGEVLSNIDKEAGGFNQAVQQQQNQLKEFFGDDNPTKKETIKE